MRTHPVTTGLGLGVAGLLLCGLGLVVEPRQTYASYLAAYATGLSLGLGALSLVMISHVTGARWFVALRRLTEGVAATLPFFAVLFLPLLFGLQELYPWIPPLEALGSRVRESVEAKRAYLNVPFFLVRAAIYFGVWSALSLCLHRWSIRQDREASVDFSRRQRALSAGGLPALALTLSFAAFDWLMSLSPAWSSPIYGVYYFAGAVVGALALLAVLALAFERAGLLTDVVAAEHYHALGKLLLTFVLFWTYIAFSQFFIVWIANVPAEVSWYLPRTRGSWGALALLLVLGHFALPFLLLLPRDAKRSPVVLASLGCWLLVMHYVDIYWLVLPELHGAGVRPHWLDLAALAAVGGLALAYGAWQLRGHPLVARGDPDLEPSLGHVRA